MEYGLAASSYLNKSYPQRYIAVVTEKAVNMIRILSYTHNVFFSGYRPIATIAAELDSEIKTIIYNFHVSHRGALEYRTDWRKTQNFHRQLSVIRNAT